MAIDKRKVEHGLEAKGFVRTNRHHFFFTYYSLDGKKSPNFTKTSHTPSAKVLGDALINLMARQCKLSTAEFRDLIECPMSRVRYESILKEKDLL